MDILKAAALAYQKLEGKNYCFTLSTGAVICIQFRANNFKHLAGLEKFSDLYVISEQKSAARLYKQILRGEITLYDLQASRYFDTAAHERIRELARIEEVLLQGKIIYPFQPSKSPIRTRLKSDVIFFKDDGFNFFLTLGAANNGEYYYPETFFFRYDQAYIQGQTIVKADSIRITQ